MKKVRISKFYIGIYVVGLSLCLLTAAIGIYGAIFLGKKIFTVAPLIIGSFGCVMIIYQLLFDFQFGSVYFNSEGIIMNIGGRKIHHPWESIVDYGFINSNVGDGDISWIYFSERPLNEEEKRQFLKKTRRDIHTIAFFQYNEVSLRSIIPVLPAEISAKIQKEEKEIREKMTWIEKTYHK